MFNFMKNLFTKKQVKEAQINYTTKQKSKVNEKTVKSANPQKKQKPSTVPARTCSHFDENDSLVEDVTSAMILSTIGSNILSSSSSNDRTIIIDSEPVCRSPDDSSSSFSCSFDEN